MFETCSCKHRRGCELGQKIAEAQAPWQGCPRDCDKGWLMNAKKEMYRCECMASQDLRRMAERISNKPKVNEEIDPKEIFA